MNDRLCLYCKHLYVYTGDEPFCDEPCVGPVMYCTSPDALDDELKREGDRKTLLAFMRQAGHCDAYTPVHDDQS